MYERCPESGATVIEILIAICLAAAVLLFAAKSASGLLVEESRAKKAASTFGFSDVEVTRKSVAFVKYRGCSGSDDARFEMKGKNVRGVEVVFAVCCGAWAKDCSISIRK